MFGKPCQIRIQIIFTERLQSLDIACPMRRSKSDGIIS